MKTIISISEKYLSIGLLACLFACLTSCTKENFTQTTNTRPNISTYLDQHPEEYSEFFKMLELTGNRSYLDAWGKYTVFAPNNDAVNAFLAERGKSTVNELDINELKNIVKLHILQDTVSTANFKDGKINQNNIYGQFITTNVENIDGRSYFILNKKSKILQANIRVGNGIIHGVDKVFSIVVNTLAQQIANDPDLSIFNEALQLTGLSSKLDQPVQNDEFLSVLAVSNQYYNQIGINSVQDLVDEYSNTGNPALPTDGLYLNIAYKILNDLKYVSDIMLQNSHTTLAPKEIVLVKLDKEKVILNEEEWLGNLEVGSEIDRNISDVTTTNGVLHYIKGDLYIKDRKPFPVYWDLQDQPELIIAGYRKKLAYNNIPHGFFKDITWQNTTSNAVSYNYADAGSSQGSVHDDTFTIVMRTATNSWVEFKTPVIVKGRYKVWISWRTMAGSGSCGNVITASVDGKELPRTLLNSEYRNRTLSERELEGLGYKKYFAGTPSGANNYNCRLMGIVDVETTDRHVFRMTTNTNCNVAFKVDMVQFIPVELDQLYPQIDREGNLVYP